MGEMESTYQLRRMVLVNAGTNQRVPSNLITELDPRGGAAVLGENGVGKTTTLRLIPLFFGHLPSQIVAGGHGQEAMIRFVLPTDASAIAFEYQRGSDDEADLRLAVMRRRADDHDVPFYRLYKGGFKPELFVSERRFLTDEETNARALELGLETPSEKLSPSQYRSVILRTPATSRDRDKLRRYSVEWSFGPKSLENLDRVVAAMVKKHVNFNDIIQVAVGLVQQDLGQGAEKARVTFKQGRSQIDSWLRNREACMEAFGRSGEFQRLEDDLEEHRAAEGRMRSCRADAIALAQALRREQEGIKASMDSMAAAREQAHRQEVVKAETLGKAVADCARSASSSKLAWEEAAATAKSFEDQQAAQWERKLLELPTLRSSLRTLQDQLELSESRHVEATQRYNHLETNARTAAAEQKLQLEKSKAPHAERLNDALMRIGQVEELEFSARNQEAEERRASIDAERERLIGEQGSWGAASRRPNASHEAMASLDAAREKLQKHTEDVAMVGEVVNRAKVNHLQARREFEDQEGAVTKARGEVAQAKERLARAKLALDPGDGTLMAALKSSASSDWRRNLARVIDPALLGRSDLDATLAEEGAESVFGWSLNTGVLTTPEWADEELARRAVEEAEQRVGRCEAHLGMQEASLATKSLRVKEAENAVRIAEARLNLLEGQSTQLKDQLHAAKGRVEKEERLAKGEADEALRKIGVALEGLKQQRDTMDREHAASKVSIKETHDRLRKEAKEGHKATVEAIDAQLAQIDATLDQTIQGISAQLREHLTKEGVNVERLASLKLETAAKRGEVQELEARESLVERWIAWNEAGGAAAVEGLKAAAARAAEAWEGARKSHRDHEERMSASAAEHAKAVSSWERNRDRVDDDLTTIEGLEEAFGDYQAFGQSVIDPATPASKLKGAVRTVRAEIDRLDHAIAQRTSLLRQVLTAKNSSVKDLVEASMGEVAQYSSTGRAAELLRCYREVGPQIATDVNNSLKAILTNIGAFHKSIQSFERQVAAFNRTLQDGLNEVKCFERVQDLRLDIVTNFDRLGFYKKLSRMDEVIREHGHDLGRDPARELPSDDAARALAEFMSVLGSDGNVEVNLSAHIDLKGSVSDNGQHKEFRRASELENISSEGLTSLVMITLMTALLNTIRGKEPVHVPWVSDEVGKFDARNFRALLQRLLDNRIDVVTASPELGPGQQAMFARRYLFEDRGRIRQYRQKPSAREALEVGAVQGAGA